MLLSRRVRCRMPNKAGGDFIRALQRSPPFGSLVIPVRNNRLRGVGEGRDLRGQFNAQRMQNLHDRSELRISISA